MRIAAGVLVCAMLVGVGRGDEEVGSGSGGDGGGGGGELSEVGS